MIRFVRTRFSLVCLVCFLLTSGAGVMGLRYPRLVHVLAGIQMTPAGGTGLFFYDLGFLLITVVGFWFLIIMLNPAGNKPLLILATAEKLVFVAFFFWAIGTGRLNPLFVGIALGDLAMGLVCLLYLVMGDIKPQEAVGSRQ